MRYFDIHVMFSHNNGYSIFVKGDFDEKSAINYAVENALFNECGDEECVDNITEITESEYYEATSAR